MDNHEIEQTLLGKLIVEPELIDKYSQLIHENLFEFDFNKSKLSKDSERYMKIAFKGCEEAVRCRVVTMRDYIAKAPKKPGKLRLAYSETIAYLKTLEIPKSLAAYHKHLLSAMTAQVEFFQQWEESAKSGKVFASGTATKLRSDKKVRAASRSLIAAYNELNRQYGRQDATNKNALFDYHCSLDFI